MKGGNKGGGHAALCGGGMSGPRAMGDTTCRWPVVQAEAQRCATQLAAAMRMSVRCRVAASKYMDSRGSSPPADKISAPYLQ